MNINYKIIMKNQADSMENKIKEMLCRIGFKGDIENIKELEKFILDNRLNLKTDNSIFGMEYKIIKDGEVLAGIRLVNEMVEDKENLKFTMISRIEDIEI